ncbi:dihydrofolate reductase [Rhodotorula sp. JG-1b]|nr:dihydrofolate reductase [Rhodotorula sp. JG-1b]
MDSEIDEFVRSLYPPHLFDPTSGPPPPAGKPFITLTWAQSLDAKISGARNAQVTLSGPASMQLTHRLRELHDSILVGVGTVVNDDPSLTARIPALVPLRSQPVPVILDPGLTTPADAKLLINARTGTGHPPVICTTCPEPECETRPNSNRISLPALFNNLQHPDANPDSVLAESFGRSLMIEGGAAILASFLSATSTNSDADSESSAAAAATAARVVPLVDLVVVTVAPVLIGPEGLSDRRRRRLPRLVPIATKVLGNDTVFACKPVWD